MFRIYDTPDHPCYGPVRRLHLMLMQLTADVGYDRVDERLTQIFCEGWDHQLHRLMVDGSYSEAQAQRSILYFVTTKF